MEALLSLLRVVASLLVLAFRFPWPISLLMAAGIYLLLSPHTVCRWLLVPLGLPRAAYLWGGLSTVAWTNDPRGGRLLLGALALRRNRHATVAAVDWLDQRVPYHHFRGASVVALALLDEARGNRKSALALMRSVVGLTEPLCPFRASAVAERWLAQDALRRQAWPELAQSEDKPVLRSTRFLRAAARRRLGTRDAPTRGRLVLSWLLSGSWIGTYGVLLGACESIEPVKVPDLSGGLANLLASMQVGAPGSPAILATLRAWDALLETDTWQKPWRVRASELGVSWEPVRDQLIGAARETLVDALRAHPLSPAELNQLEGAFSRSVRHELCDGIHERVEELAQRVKQVAQADPPTAPDEQWRAFALLRTACEEATRVGGEQELRLAFQSLRNAVIHAACRAYNDRDLRSLGKGMFAWLAHVSEQVGTDRDRELDRSNAEVSVETRQPSGLAFPTRKVRAALVSTLFAIIGVLLVGEGISSTWGYAALASGGKRVTADVVGHRTSKGRTTTYYVSYRFLDAGGKMHKCRGGFLASGESSVSKDAQERAKRTRKLEVVYSPSDPAWNVPATEVTSSVFSAALRMVFGFATAAASVLLGITMVRYLTQTQREASRSGRRY